MKESNSDHKRRLSDKAIKEFKKIYADVYGREISEDEAQSLGLELLTFFKLIYKPIPSDGTELAKGGEANA